MLADLYHDSETTVYNAPCLCIPLISGLMFPANTAPDTGISNGVCVYLHLTALTGPNSEPLSTISTLPILTDNGLAYGGQLASHAPKVLPKFQLEGYIDTPSFVSGENYIPLSGTPGGGTTTIYTTQYVTTSTKHFIYSYQQNNHSIWLETSTLEESNPSSIATTVSTTAVLIPQTIPISTNPYTYGEIIAMMLEGRANLSSGGEWERLNPLWFRDPWGRVYDSPQILDFTANFVPAIPQRTQFTMTLKI